MRGRGRAGFVAAPRRVAGINVGVVAEAGGALKELCQLCAVSPPEQPGADAVSFLITVTSHAASAEGTGYGSAVAGGSHKKVACVIPV